MGLSAAKLTADVRLTSDDEIVLFHDPELSRTTNGSGKIAQQPWHGVLEHVRTLKAPIQPIPLLHNVLDIILEDGAVKLNIDCKVESDPTKLFGLMKGVIEGYAGWETRLAPRLVLGVWHVSRGVAIAESQPSFLQPAMTLLPYLTRYAISMSPAECATYFAPRVSGFSLYYPALATAEGSSFRTRFAETHKIGAWTVNEPWQMRECARWGLDVIISDKPAVWKEVRRQIEVDSGVLAQTVESYVMPFTEFKNYWFEVEKEAAKETEYLEGECGPFASI